MWKQYYSKHHIHSKSKLSNCLFHNWNLRIFSYSSIIRCILSSMIIKSIKLMCEKKVSCFHNMSYLTDSYISFTLKLESWQKFFFNSLIRSSKYGKKNISDFPPCGKMVVFVTEFVIFLKTSK